MWKFLPLFVLFGCSDDTLYVANNEPVVNITEPVDGQQFDEGTAVTLRGVVQDDSPVEQLLVEWLSSIDGLLPDEDMAEPDGDVDFVTASLSMGTHVITLRAEDAKGERGDDMVTIEILDVPDRPSIEIVHPVEGEAGLEGYPFVFMAKVDDRQDLAEDLSVSMSADLLGFVCYMAIDGAGNSQCAATLPIASYNLTFEVTDTDGNSAQALASFQVFSADDYDFDGDGYSVNGGDCNDSNDTIYPGAPEICDGLDNDCSEATGIDVGSECYDDDGDGYCEEPPCMNAGSSESDCDDTDPSISPAGVEVLNGVDDDCDGFVDEGTSAYDDDGDGYCETPPCVNTANTERDCDDGDYTIYPGAIEVCDDGVDNNCDGVQNEQDGIGCFDFYYDFDGDTYGVAGMRECWCEDGSFPFTGLDSTDCYDSNANAHPGQTAYFGADRGDGSFDYDCSGSDEKQYQDISGGCAWDLVYISCECNGAGWEGSVPRCGSSGLWIDDCSATYDPICYALCLLTANPVNCLLSSCGATCDEEYTSLSQGCR